MTLHESPGRLQGGLVRCRRFVSRRQDRGLISLRKADGTSHFGCLRLGNCRSPDFLAFLATLRAVLTPYPDALTAFTQALQGAPKVLVEIDEAMVPRVSPDGEPGA